MTTTKTESRTDDGTLLIPKGHHQAPVHSPNEFHIDPETGGLLAGLGYTQHKANVKPVSPEEMKALEEREKCVAEAEDRAAQLIEQAKGEIAIERAKLDAERRDFEAEQKAANERTTKEQAQLLKDTPKTPAAPAVAPKTTAPKK